VVLAAAAIATVWALAATGHEIGLWSPFREPLHHGWRWPLDRYAHDLLARGPSAAGSQPAPTGSSGCHARGPLPDPACTPGAVFPHATVAEICTPGYAASVRDVPPVLKHAVYAAYGIPHHRPGEYEVDHLISLELGGSNAIANLWPEAASPAPGFHEKDQVENALHDAVCSGRMSLARAQEIVARDWRAARPGR
jgi:hypothetical protein